MKYYTGVGSRNTPQPILSIIYRTACKLASLGWTVRTGDADGADATFRETTDRHIAYTAFDARQDGIDIAKRFHPAWDRCKPFARKLHGRNSYQVLGHNLKTPSSFVICWTQDGAVNHGQRSIKTGGTGTAISIASHYKVPVFNLARPDHLKRMLVFLDDSKDKLKRSEKIKEVESTTADTLRITAPHFCAGLELKKRPEFNICAPIIHYMKGWELEKLT